MERTGHDAAGGDYGVRPILTPGKVFAPGPTNGSSSIEVIEPLDNILAQGHVEGRLRLLATSQEPTVSTALRTVLQRRSV